MPNSDFCTRLTNEHFELRCCLSVKPTLQTELEIIGHAENSEAVAAVRCSLN
jgi:hypothetical protein